MTEQQQQQLRAVVDIKNESWVGYTDAEKEAPGKPCVQHLLRLALWRGPKPSHKDWDIKVILSPHISSAPVWT